MTNLKKIDFNTVHCDDKQHYKEKLLSLHRRAYQVPWGQFLSKFDSLKWSARIINELACECKICGAVKCFKCSRDIHKRKASIVVAEYNDDPAMEKYFCEDCSMWAVSVAHQQENIPF